MASLNTLRTKFGAVLSVVIGLALLAFILSLKTEMGFTGNDPKVGVVDGNKINYSEYLEQYERVKTQNNASEGDPNQADMLADAAWQALLDKYVLEPGFEQMGIEVGDVERRGMISGDYPSQLLISAFGNPSTGAYDVASVAEFLTQAETNPQAAAAWENINVQMVQQRTIEKYRALVKGGTFTNKLEVANGVKAADNKFTGRWVRSRYESVPDSLISISKSEIKDYYNSHKNMFEQMPNRALSYVVFDVAATDTDMAALESTVRGVGAEFAATDDIKGFVRANRNGQIEARYMTAAQLPEDEAAVLLAGKTYGPVLKNNSWTMSRVVDAMVTPDTLGIRHIVLQFGNDKLADSLLTALRAGADFAQAAQNYSMYQQTAANGGDVGKIPFSSFTDEFVTALAGAKLNDIVKVASGQTIQLMQVYSVGKSVRQVQVASINYPVDASAETRRSIHNAAGTFQVKAKGSLESFNQAAQVAAVTPRVATLNQGERELRGLEDSRDLTRWIYEAKPGDVSEIFNVDGDYVVAVLTAIDDEKFAPMDRVEDAIRQDLMREKKFEYIAAKVSGESFDQKSQQMGQTDGGVFEGVDYSMFFIQDIGMEPRLVGAISASQKGAVSAPVKGGMGVYVFAVDDVTTESKQTMEAERVRIQSRVESFVEQRSLQAIRQMAKMEDLRGKYL